MIIMNFESVDAIDELPSGRSSPICGFEMDSQKEVRRQKVYENERLKLLRSMRRKRVENDNKL